MNWHLAQLNVARTKAPFGDPALNGLTSRITEMNALAESSPGFVWRFTAESDSDNRLEVFSDYFKPFDRDYFFFNMSVWRSVDALKHYAFNTAHLELFRERHTWTVSFPRANAVLWWIQETAIPSVAEGRCRLLSIDQSGPTAFAFNFSKLFPSPSNN